VRANENGRLPRWQAVAALDLDDDEPLFGHLAHGPARAFLRVASVLSRGLTIAIEPRPNVRRATLKSRSPSQVPVSAFGRIDRGADFARRVARGRATRRRPALAVREMTEERLVVIQI